MNIPNELRIVVPEGYPTPPFMRRYMLPEEGHVWLKRDFSSQEVRILAHFEDGALMRAYQEDPDLDPHSLIGEKILETTGVEYERKDVKITVFSDIYGAGINSLAEQLGRPRHEAAHIKHGIHSQFPGIADLKRAVTKIGDKGDYIVTWGGRRYFAEPSVTTGGRTRKFSYKLLNYLIQGSAADQTKDCLIHWYDNHNPSTGVSFSAAVHDELNISAPEDCWEEAMRDLKNSMERGLFDVPMRSEGFYGPNWFDLKGCF